MSNGGSVCGPISSYSRVRILHLLFEARHTHPEGQLSIGELCEATGLHANTQIPKVIGFARIAQIAGEDEGLAGATARQS